MDSGVLKFVRPADVSEQLEKTKTYAENIARISVAEVYPLTKKVVKILKVSIDRLESALERFPDWRALSRRRQRERERSQQRERDESSPVSARFEGATLIVTVKKPRFRQKVEAGANEEGDFEIRFTHDDDRYRDMVKRAKEIAGEN
jgi:hypothetical protein